MKTATFWASVAAAAFGVLFFVGQMFPRGESSSAMQLSKFGKIPVIEGGRIKPLDSYARVQLMLMNRRQTYHDEFDERQPAVRWLLNNLAEGYAQLQLVISVDPEAQQWYGLQRRPMGRFMLDEIVEVIRKKQDELVALARMPADNLSPLEQKVLAVSLEARQRDTLVEAIHEARKKAGEAANARVFRIDNDQLLAMLNLKPREGFRYSYREIVGRGKKDAYQEAMGPAASDKYFQQFYNKARQAGERPQKDRDLQDVKAMELYTHLQTDRRLQTLSLGRPGEQARDRLLMVPGPTDDVEGWKSLGDALLAGDENSNPAAAALEKIVHAYAVNNPKLFNKEVDAYLKSMQARMPAEMGKVRTETWFNHFAPFYQCANLYVLVLLLSITSWVVWQEPLRWSAFWLSVTVLLVHTFALGLRMYLTGRPPVTNLYSSAVFIGWGCVLLCLLVEVILWWVSIRAYAVPLVVASVLGFATMIVAHHLGGSGDTMEVMQAVLDTNFWLATHVVAVTLGYTATFVAGFLATVFVFLMLATAVRKFFADREAPVGKEALLFVLAVLGWLAIPTFLVVGIFCGLWVLWSGGEVLSLGVAITLSLPLLLAAGVYAGLVMVRRFSKSQEPTPAGEMPPLVSVLDLLALRQNSSKILSTVIYGIVCFATLLSFVGTVLGGIWADQSWGRFWGWDPKENGALLIVVMNALVLHACWGGMIRERGLAALAIMGNMVTAWSWFGTNQLGVGLHAYGFNTTLALGCSIFWVSQLGLIGLALMPLRFWRAYADKPLPASIAMPGVPPGPRLSGGRGGTGIQPA